MTSTRDAATAGLAAVMLTAVVAGCGSHKTTSAPRPSGSATAPATVSSSVAAQPHAATGVPPRPGTVPPPLSRTDVYAADHRGMLSPTVKGEPNRVYVPNTMSDTVDVIDQRTFKVVSSIPVGRLPQHVTPSWDLRTLWVSNDKGNTLTAIDPRTSKVRRTVKVRDPYNLYFTPDGRRAIVVAEALQRLDFRDPQTMALRKSLPVRCAGVDHMDYTADGRTALVSCEFSGQMVVVDLAHERVLRYLPLAPTAMPQDVKLSPNGRRFYVADMASGGVWTIDARTLHRRFRATGKGAHGLYVSRNSRVLFVSNRDEGTISVLGANTGRHLHKWHLPGGGSPDMGGVSASGRVLWLSGRYNGVVYAIDTHTGKLLHRIAVGKGPHGMAVWPQPGRYSIGHTGIMR
jgi:YVTN family beta-propeller protein